MKKMISMLICLAMVMAMTMAVPFAVLAAEGDSGSIAVEAEYRGAGIAENYVKNYTFTAPKDGEYTFSVPAGLGVWDMVGYLLGDESMHYVNYATNTAGATFTLTLKAGEQFRFYVGTNSADVTSGTITWSIAAPPDPNAGSIPVEAHYDGPNYLANYITSYTFTPQVDGVYTFTVPAGLGVWERVGYWLGDPSTHYVDCSTNTAGGTFTLTLMAGQSFMFYVGTNSPDVTSGTITWTRAEIPQASPDQLAADAVIAKINEIGIVSLTSKETIEATRAAYEALTDAQKALVTNYEVLTAAEAELKALEDQIANAPNSGSFPVVAEYRGSGQHQNYKKSHTFTAQKDGEYTFFVPAGLGVWEFWGYWDYVDGISPNNKLYVDYATNTEGKTFTLTLKAGEDFKFYVGTNSPDLTSGTITWAIDGTPLPEQPNNDQVAADAVIAQIEAIGTVTKDSKAAITAARAAYDALTDAQKALVTNYNALTKAEADFEALPSDPVDPPVDPEQPTDPNSGSIQVKTKYVGTGTNENYLNDYTFIAKKDGEHTFFVPAGLGVWEFMAFMMDDGSKHYVDYATNTEGATFTLTLKAGEEFWFVVGTNSADLTSGTITWTIGGGNEPEQPNADQVAADAVITLIDAIGTVTKDSEAAITAARAAYDKLTDVQKRLVTNYNTLTKAEADFEALPSDPVNPPVDPDQPIIPAGDDTFVFFALVVLSMTALVVLVSKKRTF
jgi:hypothetical protein